MNTLALWPEHGTIILDVVDGRIMFVEIVTPRADDPDPGFQTYTHLHTSTARWTVGSVDPLLRAVADDQTGGAIITDTGLKRLYHPYDGGADLILTTTAERDQFRARHCDWLSCHPSGP